MAQESADHESRRTPPIERTAKPPLNGINVTQSRPSAWLNLGEAIMDWSLLLGFLGILVSIVVGWLTYRLADRRARNQRYFTAKSTVLQELSKSLGEDSVPTPNILEATIRSVLLEVGDPSVQINVGEVLDDLTRQVTSDPFLGSERRRKLQTDIETVRSELVKGHLQEEQPKESATEDMRNAPLTLVPAIIGMLAAMVTLTPFLTSVLGSRIEGSMASEFMKRVRPHGDYVLLLLGALLVLVCLFCILVLNQKAFKKTAELFRGRKQS